VNEYEKKYREAIQGTWMEEHEARTRLCREYAWAVPCDEALEVLAGLGPIVEGGAGSGYWTHLLRERGVDVVAYDVAPHDNEWVKAGWSDVLVGGAEQMAPHRDRTLLLVWPPYDDRMALDHVMAHGGQTVCYVGEGEYGCTGDDAFHRYLDENFEVIAEVDIPRWRNIGDSMWVYRRKAA